MTASYAYDALGRRFAKSVGPVTSVYIYEPQDLTSTAQITLMEFRSGALFRRWANSGKIDDVIGYEEYAGTTAAGSGQIAELFADRIGSITIIVDSATNAVVSEFEYDGFGRRKLVSGEPDQLFGFIGRDFDLETGLSHLRARDYSADIGLFTTVDPIEFQGGTLNLYEYTSNNPLLWTDPSGLAVLIDNRELNIAKKHAQAEALQSTANGVFSLANRVFDQIGGIGNIGNFPTLNVDPGSAGKPNLNIGRNNKCSGRGQHIYAIYDTKSGETLKVGLGNNDKLFAGGKKSKRALDQIAQLRRSNPNLAHVVMLVTPDGPAARLAGLWLEQVFVDVLGDQGWKPGKYHKRPLPGAPFASPRDC